MIGEAPFCCQCKSDFPIAEEPTSWGMGALRPLRLAPKRLRDRFASWLAHPEGSFLCGNCYFDLTDEW